MLVRNIILGVLTFVALVHPPVYAPIYAQVQTPPSPSVRLLDYKAYDDPALLSVGEIRDITQDQQGFIWIGGNRGLLRYDGYTFKAFVKDEHNPETISTHSITDLLLDDKGYLWIATYWKLNRYDPSTGKFKRFGHDPNAPRSLSHNAVMALAQGANGHIWVGTAGGGLNRFNPVSQDFDHYSHDSDTPNSLADNNVQTLLEDSKGKLWVGFKNKGVDRFDPNTHKVLQRFRAGSQAPNLMLTHNNVICIREGKHGNVWLATTDNGLNRFNFAEAKIKQYPWVNSLPRGARIWHPARVLRDIFIDPQGQVWIAASGEYPLTRYRPESDDFERLRLRDFDKRVLSESLYIDRSGGLWIGFSPLGLVRVDRYGEAFDNHWHRPGVANSLSDSNVVAIAEDDQGNLLLGTRGGFNVLHRDSGQVSHYPHSGHKVINDEKMLSARTISAILPLGNHQVWLGNAWRGIDHFDLREQKVLRRYRPNKEDSHSLGHGEVWSLFKDSQGQIWVGGNGGMLHRYRPTTDDFQRFRLMAPHKKDAGRIIQIYEDRLGDLWFASDDGVFRSPRRDRRHNTLALEYMAGEGKTDFPLDLQRHSVRALTEDHNGNMWFGTEGRGVQYWHRQQGVAKTYRHQHGLPHDSVYGILQDTQGGMWFSTAKGIARLDLNTQQFTHYTKDHGLRGSNFNPSAYYSTRRGELAFGGSEGLVLISPDKAYRNTYVGPTIISDFRVFNQSMALPHALTHQHTITLDHTQSVFSFHLSALNYDLPHHSQYAYKLEGFDNTWNQVGTQRSATYTNLDPGVYLFKAKNANSEGLWNKNPAQIYVEILPPWWASWWAKLLYAIASANLLALLLFTFLQHKRAKDKQQLNEKLLDLDRVKDEFLANTSHELRTPLNGIIGLSEALIDGLDGPPGKVTLDNLKLIVNSGKRLSYLINDILDFSKLQEHSVTLHRTNIDLYGLTQNIFQISQALVDQKSVMLVNDVDKYFSSVNADEHRLHQILYNLIGNAIKFTEQGSITVSACLEDGSVWVQVADTGVGIHKDQQTRIFNAFEQAQGTNEHHAGGTGLGLAVTKQLVELHGGKIELHSTIGQGTQVRFSLSASDKVVQHKSAVEAPAPVLTTEESLGEGKYHILVVDDEPVNRKVLTNLLLIKHYRVTQVSTGYSALALLDNKALGNKESAIDLVLLDITMPGMSGFDVCRRIRQKFPLLALPIIFLTARSQVNDMSEAYASGGNDFLNKPIAKEELYIRLETQLKLLESHQTIEAANKQLKKISITDELTQLRNRKYYRAQLEKAWNEAQQAQTRVGIVLVDIDYFKKINDQYGHSAGDECLRHAGKIFTQFRQQWADGVARYGGEEFALLLLGCADQELEQKLEQLRKEFEKRPVAVAEDSITMTVSIGAYNGIPASELSVDQAIDWADQALYRAKREGRNQCRLCLQETSLD